MSFRYPAGLITASSPVNANYPSGVWTPRQALPYLQNNVWGQDSFFDQTVLLLHGDGTNGAQNNTFLDSSSNNFTITRNGNTTQGTFTPFSLAAGEWSNYFDGNGDYLSLAGNAAFSITTSTTPFTIEGWVYITAAGGCLFTEQFTGGANSVAIAVSLCDGVGVETTTGRFIGFGWFNGTAWTSAAISTTEVALNTWTHVACVFTGSTTKIYLNGVDSTKSSSPTPATTWGVTGVNGDGWFIGRRWSAVATEFLTGYISNLRFVKGRAVYTSAFTPSTAPLGATSGGTNPPQGTETSLLTCQSNRFVDNGGLVTPNTITRNGDVRVTPFSPFQPLLAYSPGVTGGSGYFDGTGDYLQTPSNSAVSAWSTDCTIECWFYLESLSTVRVLLGNSTANSDGFFLAYVYTDGKIAIGRVGVTEIASAAGVIRTNEWYHVAFIKSSTTATIYVNGVSVASGASSAAFETTTTKPFSVGVTFQSSGSANWLGYVSNVRVIKNQALTTGAFTPPTAPVTTSAVGWTGANVAASITGAVGLLLDFTNAGILDNTAKNVLETVGNAQIDTAVVKYGTGAMEFDGTGDYLDIPPTPDLYLSTGDFTIEGWVYTNNSGANQQIMIRRSALAARGIAGNINASSANKLTFVFGDTSTSAWEVTLTSTTSLVNSVWYHFAVVRSGNNFALYINGVSEATATSSVVIADDTSKLRIGADDSGTSSMNGYIDDLRITKGIARYTANFVPPIARFPNQ